MISVTPRNGYEQLLFKALDPKRTLLAQKTHKVGLLILAALFSLVTLGFGGFLIKKFCRVYRHYRDRLIVERIPAFKLTVREETDLEKFPAIIAIAQQWVKIASDRQLKTSDKSDNEQLNSSRAVSQLIVTTLKMADDFSDSRSRLLVCQDVALKAIQALAVVRPMEAGPLELLYLVTHPNNLKIEANKSLSSRVDGCGGAIICHLKAEVTKEARELYLESYYSAVPFYEKMGFQRSHYLPESPPLVPMEFKPEGIS